MKPRTYTIDINGEQIGEFYAYSMVDLDAFDDRGIVVELRNKNTDDKPSENKIVNTETNHGLPYGEFLHIQVDDLGYISLSDTRDRNTKNQEGPLMVQQGKHNQKIRDGGPYTNVPLADWESFDIAPRDGKYRITIGAEGPSYE
ncbi:MAG: hypothetical protein GOV00_01195 [Candidatus Altiarchaeota archaeon]|nr:hypothetical protein [Candidatus Altiarchaeota archaeon]